MKWFIKKLIRPKGNDAQNERGSKDSNPEEGAPIWLSWEQLRGHSVIVGNEGTGKTALMGYLAHGAIQHRAAVVVIDLDGDLAPGLLAQVPSRRAKDVCWIDFNDTARVPGFNLLDVSHGEASNLIVTNLVRTARGLWGEYWKPDVEDALKVAVRTLLAANRALVPIQEPQFTLLDVARLFEYPDFCRRLLRSYVTDPDVIEWWNAYLERPREWVIFDFAAVLTPLHRLTDHPHMPNILGQSNSTFDLRELLEPGRITLLNLSRVALTSDLRYWLAALIADRINLTVLARDQITPEIQSPAVVIAVNGTLPIPCLNDLAFLADLHERGVSYILSNWSATYPEDPGPALPEAMLAKATNLFVFRTRGYDEDVLSGDLGVPPQDIVNLPNHVCYVRTHKGNRNVLVKRVATLPPLASDTQSVRRILDRVKPYGRRAADVKAERERFTRIWYGREMAALRKRVGLPPMVTS